MAKLLAKLATCDWRVEAERQRVYTQFVAALDRIRDKARAEGRPSQSDVDDDMLRKTVLAIENAVEGAATLDDVRMALKVPGGPHPGEQAGRDLDERAPPSRPKAGAGSSAPVPSSPPRPLSGDWIRSRHGVMLLALSFVVAVLSAVQLWQLARPQEPACTASSTACFDSGWQPVSNAATTTYFFRHALGQVPTGLTLWFSPTKEGTQAYLITWKFPRPESGNPVTIEARADAVYVHVWNGVPIHGVYDARVQNWKTFNEGFYRVVAQK